MKADALTYQADALAYQQAYALAYQPFQLTSPCPFLLVLLVFVVRMDDIGGDGTVRMACNAMLTNLS
jgi:hypothetical protein